MSTVSIRECGEPLVDLRKACPGIFISLARPRMEQEQTAYLRKRVAAMLRRAKGFLPRGMTFVVGDTWRSSDIQRTIMGNFIRRVRRTHPSWSDARIKREVGKFVAPFRGRFVSGHMTGGAVDLRLLKNGRKLPMKSRFLSYQENAQSQQPKLPHYLQQNREIMFRALRKAGLSNYPKEYWHWSYGDAWWAKREKRKIAMYGMVKAIYPITAKKRRA